MKTIIRKEKTMDKQPITEDLIWLEFLAGETDLEEAEAIKQTIH